MSAAVGEEAALHRPLHSGKAPFDKDTSRTVYVLVRTDLPLAQQAVQAIHAGMQATARFGGLSPDTRLALLAIGGSADLADWQDRLSNRGIPFTTFWEPDHGTGESALATPPLERHQGKAFARLPLWGSHDSRVPALPTALLT